MARLPSGGTGRIPEPTDEPRGHEREASTRAGDARAPETDRGGEPETPATRRGRSNGISAAERAAERERAEREAGHADARSAAPASDVAVPEIDLESSEAYFSRELSWLAFARRVISLIERPDLPLLERIKFVGIAGMLHDEFFMKRMSGLKRRIKRGSSKLSDDGRSPKEEFAACREEILRQVETLGRVMDQQIRPALAAQGPPILDYDKLDKAQHKAIRAYVRDSVVPILTPLAVDSEHPFPFISNLGLNLAVVLPDSNGGRDRFVRLKIPDNRTRWVPLPDGAGFTPLEQAIARNLDLLYPDVNASSVHLFRVTRGADGEVDRALDLQEDDAPGSIIQQVSHELKARRFAGVVRVQIDADTPKRTRKWLTKQLGVEADDVYPADHFLGLSDLLQLKVEGRPDLSFAPHEPVVHPRLRDLEPGNARAIFEEIDRGDILLHHPYHSFDSSVLRFIESAAADPNVLAIKLTIYRTSPESPIVTALVEAARRGKQVAVVVEVTARFDEAPNIAWGKLLEREGVHVAYGVERLKTHVKLALVVRQEGSGVRLYAHAGTGNYHTRTARIYEDLGILTSDPVICADAAQVFNSLTGTTPYTNHTQMLVAPASMRNRFIEMIQREAEHARAGRRAGIAAKMNQLQDPEIIRALYRAGRAGVPIDLNVRGLCCLRPGVPGLSENIRVFGLVGRFLEHSRIYRFVNDDAPEYYMGSADWMKRNLSNRVETVVPVLDAQLQEELDRLLDVYDRDNSSAWDCEPDGTYILRTPAEGAERCAAQETFIESVRDVEDAGSLGTG